MVTVVLLPGLDGSATLFEPFVAALGQQHEVRAISYPSTVPLGYAELEGLGRSSLPKVGPFVVLGEFFSGPVAVGLAAEPPPGLLGIVLCCSFARNPRPFLSLLGWVIALVPVKLAPVSLLAVALLGRHSNPYWRSALAEALSPVSAVALRARLRAVLEVNALPRLAESKVPVLYLRATEDRVVPVSASKSVAQALPSVTIIPLPGPHFLLQVSPEPAAVAVHDFIRTLSPALQLLR